MSGISRLGLDFAYEGEGRGCTHDDEGADLLRETFVETGHYEAEDCLDEYS
jgi:hypothetical protein